jgi:hypothetical protein
LGVRGVRVVITPFINAFQKKKAWNLPKSSTNLSDFQNLFFFSSKCGGFKTLFFPLLEMWRFSFFLGNFSKCSLHHVCFQGGLFNGFSSQKIDKIKIKLAALRLCVFSLGLKKPGDFTMSEGHGYPLIYIYMKESNFFCFVVMRSNEPGCFRSCCSWCLWKAPGEEGCMMSFVP